MKQNEHIQKFLIGWKRERDHYENLAERARIICERALQSSAIQAQVTCRAKDLGSLRNKLVQRNSTVPGGYKSDSHIRQDIVDLAGVRIALYFPNHRAMVEKMILKEFNLHKEVEHGADTGMTRAIEVEDLPEEETKDYGRRNYVARFSGYRARHYRVSHLHDANMDNEYQDGEDMDSEGLKMEPEFIEIQVISMLHHTWAEVSHDLVYKQMSGLPSPEEERILDSLSGLINVGEVLLEQLHGVYQARSQTQNIKFANHYELGSFLSTRKLPSEFSMGPLDILLKFLGTIGYDNPRDLTAVIGSLEGSKWRSDQGLISEVEDTTSLKPSVSATLIATILSRIDHENVSRRKRAEVGDQQLYQLKAMASTIALLDELFPPFTKWTGKLFAGSNRSSVPNLECLTWLTDIRNVESLLDGESKLLDGQRAALKAPWDWFCEQSNCVITLVFRVATMGLFTNYSAFSMPRNILIMHIPVTEADVPERILPSRSTYRSSAPGSSRQFFRRQGLPLDLNGVNDFLFR